MPTRKSTGTSTVRKSAASKTNGKTGNGHGPIASLPESHVKNRIGFLKAGDIRSDPNYQRPLEQSAVQRIVANFDADAFGLPFILEDEHKVPWAIDGQTRVAAVVQMYGPDTLIECEIVSNITMARAAQLFRQRNASRQVLPIDKFLAGVTAGDPECVAINDVVRSVGLSVERSGGQAKGVVRGVSTMQTIYRGLRRGEHNQRPDLLKQTLIILGEAWGPQTTTFSAAAMMGLAMVLERYGRQINIGELIAKLKSYPGGALRMVASGKALKDSLGGSTAEGVALSIVHRYNTGKRTGKLPDWREAKVSAPDEE